MLINCFQYNTRKLCTLLITTACGMYIYSQLLTLIHCQPYLLTYNFYWIEKIFSSYFLIAAIFVTTNRNQGRAK